MGVATRYVGVCRAERVSKRFVLLARRIYDLGVSDRLLFLRVAAVPSARRGARPGRRSSVQCFRVSSMKASISGSLTFTGISCPNCS